MKNIRVFLCENFQFLEVKFSTYLYRRVFVMQSPITFLLLDRFSHFLPNCSVQYPLYFLMSLLFDVHFPLSSPFHHVNIPI